ncbi:MAG: DNA alkylation repair protein [Aquabacterium sp.]
MARAVAAPASAPAPQPWLAGACAEVEAALQAIARPARGEAVRIDRGSQMVHLGIPVPELRARVRAGFSFDARPHPEQLAVWDALWRTTRHADVLLAAVEHWVPRLRQEVPPGLWPVVRHWADRVDNWCVSDALSGLYARLLQTQFDDLHPQLQRWNAGTALWPRRLSLTSLVQAWGRDAVFLPAATMRPLLDTCANDHRHYIQLALGWVLRELGRANAAAADAYLLDHAGTLGAKAWARALEKRTATERAAWAGRRRAATDRAG